MKQLLPLILGGLLALGHTCVADSEKPTAHPNILIIFADDLGYETVGAYGGLDFSTPEIDAMSREGLLFSRAYTSPVCTPSRVSFHTSLYTVDHGHTDVLPVHNGTEKIVDFERMPTFAQLLKADGYQTSVTGKWQLATLCHHPDHPFVTGFDSWCVWQIWDCEHNAKTTRYENPFINRDGVVLDGSEMLEERLLPNGVTLPAGTVLPDATKQFGSDVLHTYVKGRMNEAVQAKEPFFILHNMMLPHVPIVTTPKGERSLKGMVAYMDYLVGDLLDEVDRLGIREHTYVFFIGDNGTQSNKARMTTAGEVHGGKWQLNDAGTHVPFIVWGPASVRAGKVADDLVDITDVFPTICELAGVAIPEDRFLRGYSIAPQIHGQAVKTARTFVHGGISGANSIFDGQWRLNEKRGNYTLVDSRNLPAETEPTLSDENEATVAFERLRFILESLK